MLDPQTVIPEILAPAGGRQQFFAALNSGADAVFLGLESFNARARATNFTAEDLKELVPVAHAFGMKVLVTVNILIKQLELPELFRTLDTIEASGADAIIVQDLAVARLAKKYFPAIRLHASTQMAVHNVTGVLEAAKFGFKRVVLARELTHQEVRKIRAAVPRDVAELEAFCHGSLCYSYSGLCFFSGAEDARSGNRGECAYTCRQPYKIINEPGHGFLFSMKDLDTSKSLDLLIKAGIDTLKIEGRKKDAQYVATSVKLYRQNLNRLFGKDTLRKSAPASAFEFIHDNRPVETDLEFAFKRQPTSFFLKSRYQENVIDLDNPTHKGLEVGSIISVSNGQITFRTQHPIELYDGLRIVDTGKVFHSKPQDGTNVRTELTQSIDRYENKHSEFSVRSIYVRSRSKVNAKSGDVVTIGLPETIKIPSPGSQIFKVRSADLKARIEKIAQLPADIRLTTHDHIELKLNVVSIDNNGLEISVICKSGSFEFNRGPYPIQAERPRSESRFAQELEAILSVFGDAELISDKVTINGDSHWFVPKSVLKKFKSALGQELKDTLLQLRADRFETCDTAFSNATEEENETNTNRDGVEFFSIKTDRLETALSALSEDLNPARLKELIFEPKRAFMGDLSANTLIDDLISKSREKGVTLRLAVPTVVRAWDEPLLSKWFRYAFDHGVRHFEVGNVGGPELVFKWTGSREVDLSADFTLYALNSEAHAAIRDLGIKSATLSVEDDLDNISAQAQMLTSNAVDETSVILYKDTPLFIAEACSLTALHNGCPSAAVCGYRTLEIENKEGERFFVAHESCKSVVYGKKAFGVTHLKQNLKNLGFKNFRLDFLTRHYTQAELSAIIEAALNGCSLEQTHSANFTRTLL
jgi:putative protease